MPKNDLLTTSGVAELAGVKPGTVRRWRKAGLLTASQATLGGQYRFDRAEVERLLRRKALGQVTE